jgi:glycosyltransferase involved in cell wall biosynthesis
MAVLAAGKRQPVLMTYHAGSMLKGSGIGDALIGFYERHLLPRIFKRATSIGAVLPEFVKKHTADDTKVHFTPPGIDTNLYTPDHASKKKTDIIFVGRIEKTSDWKGLDVLFKALSLLKEDMRSFTAQIIGKGDAFDDYKQLAKDLNIADNIEFLTDLQGEAVIPFYQQAKIIILPSKTEAESFGMVLAEAMACGVTAIGSRIGGIPNVIEHNVSGLLVPPNDPSELHKAIRNLLNDPKKRAALSKNGVDRIRTQFTLKQMLQTNIELLRQLSERQIVHIAAYYPPNLGGMELAASMLTEKLHATGHRVAVVTSKPDMATIDTSHEVAPENFPVTRLPATTIASTPLMPRLLWTLLRTSHRSIFHVHIAQAGIPEVAFLAAKLKRIPIVMHLHGDVEASSAAGILLPLYKKIFLGFVLRHADTVIVPTKNYKNTMRRRYNLKNDVRIIPTGIEEKYFLEKDNHVPSDRTTILYAGRLSVEKNIPLIIEAVQAVSRPIHLIIAGDGPLQESLQKLAAKNTTTQKIELIGRKTSDELLAYYQSADIFVLASNYESQSLATLEAMASGTPVIVANVPAVNEIVGEAGVLVEKTVAGFAQAITQLIEDPAHKESLSKKGRARAEEFSWDTLLSKFEDVYDRTA